MIGDSLLRNSLLLMGTTLVNSALGYGFWVVAARSLVPHAVGVATAIISALTLASLLSNLGAQSVLVDLLPKRTTGQDWSRAINAAILASGVTGLAAAAIAIGVLPLFVGPLRVLWHPVFIVLFVCGVIFTTWSTVLDFVFVAERESGKMLVRNFLFGAVKIPLLFALVAVLDGTEGLVTSWVLGTFVSIAVVYVTLLPRLRHHYTPGFRRLGGEVRAIFRALIGQHLINLGGTIPMYALPVLVTARLSATANAYFYTTWMVGGLFFMISSWVSVSLFADGSHDLRDIGARLRRSARLIAALAAPCIVVMIVFGHLVLRLFGPSYVAGYGLLVVLAASALPDAITNLYVSMLRLERRIAAAARLNVGMAIVTLVLAWMLVPGMGIVGGGWAWLIAETLGSVWSVLDHQRERRRAARWRPAAEREIDLGSAAAAGEG